ncbi:MAG TPA: hypothetical protein VFQ22_13965 [Longimicrobiales bacterium]|nr:hypothetical protein [Longimicrobiales bacterium]
MEAHAGGSIADGAEGEVALPFLRQTLGTLAYRAEKVLRDVPEGFAELRVSPGTRTPLHILTHMCDLMEWGARMARGTSRWQHVPAASWAEARERFFRGLADLDAALAEPAEGRALEPIFQGPIADALTHVGQLALLRGMAGAPVRPENYARARIRVGRVGPDQPAERSEFDGDASALRGR